MATLLPNGKQQFVDQNGNPLVGGKVYHYEPGTSTPKSTWIDPDQLAANTNPVVLDARGQASIYGVGTYRQVARDALDNLIWDQIVSDSSQFSSQLEADLAASAGAGMVGYGTTTVAGALNSLGSSSTAQAAWNAENGGQIPSVDKFGIHPDGITNWESSPEVDWEGFWNAAMTTGVRWPKGYYACGLNFDAAYSGSRMHFEDGSILGGVFHLISGGSPAQYQLASITRTSNIVTVVTAAPHGFTTDERIAIRGAYQAYVPGIVSLNVENTAVTVVNSTTLTFAQSGPDATGTVSGSPLGTAYVYSTPLADVHITGTLTTTDRFGTINCKNCTLERVHVMNYPARHSAYPGTGARGAHLYVGTEGLQVGELIIDYATGANTAAALAIDGFAWNPRNCSFGRVWIKDSAYNGAYITGTGHSFGELRIDAFAKEPPNGEVLQDSNSVDQTNQFKGFWVNRAHGLTISRLITNQRVQDGTRGYENQHALIDQTGDPANSSNYGEMYTGIHVGSWIARNVRRRGICFGDDATYDSVVVQARVDVLDVRVAPEGLMAGEYLVTFKGASGQNRVSVGFLRLQDTLNSLGVSVQSLASACIGELQAIQHNWQILKSAGQLEVGSIYGRTTSSGVPGDPLVLLTGSTSAGNRIGSIDLSASGAKTATAFKADQAVNWVVGAIKTRNYYSTSGTAIVSSPGGSWALDNIDMAGPSSAGVGVQFAGTIANGRMSGGRLTGFSSGLAKGSATFTASSNAAVGMTVTGNTTNTDLAAGSFDKLACSGVTL